MNKDALEQLRRELERLGDKTRGRGRSDGRHSVELEYYLSQLTDAVTAFTHLGFRSLYRHDPHPELLAHIDTLLKHTNEVRELAVRVREVLLRPLSEDKEPGFTE
jgi:hypothetical protein